MARLVNDGIPFAGWRDVARKIDSECHRKAIERGQMTFTVVEQDITAPLTILRWIELQIEKQGALAPAEKLRDAFEDMLAMLYSGVEKKFAD